MLMHDTDISMVTEKKLNDSFLLRYFNFELCFKLQWCCAQNLFVSQIPVRFELQISCIQDSYLTLLAIKPNRLGTFKHLNSQELFGSQIRLITIQTLLWSLKL